jgi:hypothetical protein
MPNVAPFAEPTPRATINRRLTIRYGGGAHTEANGASHDLSPFQKVRVLDISKGGISLILPQRPPAGAIIFLQMTNTLHAFTYDLAAEVRHTTPLERGCWLAGLAFEQDLSAGDLSALI